MKRYIFCLLIFFIQIYNYAQSTKKVDNIIVLSKLIGLVKYFYPSESVKNTDWNSFTENALMNIEPIKTNKELIDSLNNLFKSIAPNVKIIFKNEDIRSLKDTINLAKKKSLIGNISGMDMTEKSFHC